MKTALITGGGSGIGAAIASNPLSADWQVVLTGRDPARLRSAAEVLGHEGRVLTLAGDAADDDAVRSWVSDTTQRFGRLDAVVASAGLATTGWLEEDNAPAWREMVLTNVLGPALLVHHARTELARSRGRVILVGSIAGLVPTAGNLYGATKYAITGLAENLRRALTEQHVGVTLLAPGRVTSPFWDDLGGPPEGLMLDPDDLGRAAAWVLAQPGSVDVNTVTVRPFRAAV